MNFNFIEMKHILVVLFFAITHYCIAQESFDLLKQNYSGNVEWDASTSTVTFTSSGIINFSNKASNWLDPYSNKTMHAANWIWNVPTSVKKILIKANVIVTGGFHMNNVIIIEGEDRKTSKIFGTNIQTWADANNPAKLDLEEWYYCQIQTYNGTCNIKNLTILNAFSFAVRGWGPQVHMKKVDVIDTRGGYHNHSDGFEGGDNSTIDSCYFETGDDIIKVYFMNLRVTNTEIKMVQNSVPIQFGWGNYNNGASATFENCKIWGSTGRGSDVRIIDNAGSTARNKTVVMNNCTIENPNGTLFRSAVTVNAPYAINVTINNSKVKVKSYEVAPYNVNGTRTICGSTEKLTTYDCLPNTSLPAISDNKNPVIISPNPVSNKMCIKNADQGSKMKIMDTFGRAVIEKTINNHDYTIDLAQLQAGVYFLNTNASNKNYSSVFIKN